MELLASVGMSVSSVCATLLRKLVIHTQIESVRSNCKRMLIDSKKLEMSITTPQDAHKWLVLQVYLVSNMLEFTATCT